MNHSPSRRIDALFDRLKAEGRKAFVTFLVAFDPDADESLATLHALVESGIDLIELGYPFSDPILDGATIQRANQRGLAAGGGLARTLELVAAFRRTDSTTPVVLMGYANPVLVMGEEAFAERAAQAGVDGLIAADLPLREAGALLESLATRGLVMVPLSAPTVDASDYVDRPGVGGFHYCIPLVGPTGGPSASLEQIEAAVARCRTSTSLPVLVGFGIKTPDAASATARVCDGVVVASALIESVVSNPANTTSQARLSAIRREVGSYRAAINAEA